MGVDTTSHWEYLPKLACVSSDFTDTKRRKWRETAMKLRLLKWNRPEWVLTSHIKAYLTTVIRRAPLPRKSFGIWRDSRGSCRRRLQKKSLTSLKCRCYLFCASVHECSERAPSPGVPVWIIIWKVRPNGGYFLVSFHLIRVLSRCWQISDFDRLRRCIYHTVAYSNAELNVT